MTAAPPPGQHGGKAHLYGVDLELSASLNPVAPDPTPIFQSHLDSIGRYPDADGATRAMAEVLGVEPERVVLTNGGAEAIALVARQLRTGWVQDPEFSLYERHLDIDASSGRWMSDPNNPTGRLAGVDEPAAVRDEAFYPLATGQWTRGDADTIVVGSLTKVFACPGVRIGYAITPDDAMAEGLRSEQPRWSLSGLACDSVPDLLALADLPRWRDEIAALRNELASALEARGWVADPGAANFLWIPDAPGLRNALFARGILVRSAASFGMPDAVRIAVPKPSQLSQLISAIPERND